MTRTAHRRRGVFATMLMSALLAATAGSASAQDKPAPPPEQKVVRLRPKEGGYAILDLFNDIQQVTGISILYDGANNVIKTQKVDFVGVHEIPEDELFNWLQAILSYKKLVLVPVGPKSPDGKQQWFCMDQAEPMMRERPLYVDEKDIFKYQERDGLFIVTTLKLQHISDTNKVKLALNGLVTATAGIGKIQDIQGSRALIVADFAPIVAAMKHLLDYIDVVNTRITPTMKVIPLEFAVASELEPTISELIQANDTAQRQQQQRQPGGPEEEPEPKIIADNRLDALIVYATDEAMANIEELIKKLDVPSRARGRLHFRALRHTDAADMAELLDNLVSATSQGTGGTFGGTTRTTSTSRNTNRTPTRTTPSTGVNQGAGGNAFSQSAVEGAPVFVPDPKSNSLIVQASPSQWEQIEYLITRLDQSRPQVLIETSLLELSHDNDLQLGVELLGTQNDIAVDTDGDGTPDAITQAARFFGATTFGLSDLVTTEVTSGGGTVNVPTNRSPLIGSGLSVGIFKNRRLPFILNAFQSSGRARILTQPSLVTNDNEQAKITLQRKTSYKQTVRDSTNTNTDSFQQIEANTELSISPHISSDDYLRLDITESVSNFGSRPSPDAPPDQVTRQIETHVTLPDTYTVVLGGLIQEDESTSVRKIPILGDIPILGFLFRQTDDQSHPSHLFLFVTPRILRDAERFSDYHKLTWEKKLLQDDLFGEEVLFPVQKFAGPNVPPSARDRIRRLEDSGELDAGVLKAPLTDEERRKMAEEEMRRHPPVPTTQPPAPPPTTPPVPPTDNPTPPPPPVTPPPAPTEQK